MGTVRRPATTLRHVNSLEESFLTGIFYNKHYSLVKHWFFKSAFPNKRIELVSSSTYREWAKLMLSVHDPAALDKFLNEILV